MQRMAHARPHRNLTVKVPNDDLKRIDQHARKTRRSKNAVVAEWLAPFFALLRAGDQNQVSETE
jgi:predicted transcriptional regulator